MRPSIKESEYRHCPRCATRFGQIQDNVLICPACNLHFYVNPKPTNAIMLENDTGEILFVIRAVDPHKGMLDLPGGFLNINETLEESLIREVKEELGITIKDFQYISSFHDEYEHGGVSSRSVCMLFHGLLPPDAQIQTGDDAAGFVMISQKDIPYEKIAFSGMADSIQQFLR